MTILDALARIHAVECFKTACDRSGKVYGPGFFGRRDFRGNLSHENRRVAIDLIAMGTCLACGEPVPSSTTGDHIVPVSRGGPSGAQNYAPLCRSHNSSKGPRDFMDWWYSMGRRSTELPVRFLIAYARLKHQQCLREGTLQADAPASLSDAVADLMASLPTPSHRAAASSA